VYADQSADPDGEEEQEEEETEQGRGEEGQQGEEQRELKTFGRRSECLAASETSRSEPRRGPLPAASARALQKHRRCGNECKPRALLSGAPGARTCPCTYTATLPSCQIGPSSGGTAWTSARCKGPLLLPLPWASELRQSCRWGRVAARTGRLGEVSTNHARNHGLLANSWSSLTCCWSTR